MNNWIKTGVVALGVGFVGAAALQGLENQRQIDIQNCESIPEYCPYRAQTAQTSAVEATTMDTMGMQIVISLALTP